MIFIIIAISTFKTYKWKLIGQPKVYNGITKKTNDNEDQESLRVTSIVFFIFTGISFFIFTGTHFLNINKCISF